MSIITNNSTYENILKAFKTILSNLFIEKDVVAMIDYWKVRMNVKIKEMKEKCNNNKVGYL